MAVAAIKDGAVAPLINFMISLAVVVGLAVPQCGRFEAWVSTLDQDSSKMVLLRSLLYDPATEHSFNLQVLSEQFILNRKFPASGGHRQLLAPLFTILPTLECVGHFRNVRVHCHERRLRLP